MFEIILQKKILAGSKIIKVVIENASNCPCGIFFSIVSRNATSPLFFVQNKLYVCTYALMFDIYITISNFTSVHLSAA